MKYFDYAATCPLHKEAAEAYIKASTEYFGNSNSLHDIGNQAHILLENCREQWAKLIGVSADGIYFTSGGTESNFLGIQALLSSSEKKGKHIISGVAEHSSIIGNLKRLEREGYETTLLKLNEKGVIDPLEIQNTIRKDTVLIAIQHGNSEIGSLQPIQELHQVAKEHDILFHSDCVHTFGKIDLKEISQIVDSLSISGHKFYGPKGIGLLYVSPKVAWKPFYHNVSHEKGIRPGTVNLPGVVAMTVAAQIIEDKREAQYLHYWKLRDAFMKSLEAVETDIVVYHFEEKVQIPSTIGMRVKGIEGQWVMLEANRKGFAISTGSACHVGKLSPSNAMRALGVEGKEAKEFFRVSFGLETTEKDVTNLAHAIIEIIQSFRER